MEMKLQIKPRRRASIFRRILFIFILLSVIPVAFSSFLTISTYQDVIGGITDQGVFTELELAQLRQNIFIQIILMLVLLIVLVVFSSVVIAKGITKPLSFLVESFKDVAVGNLNVRFKLKSNDELGELSDAFNDTITQLKEQREREKLVSQMKTEFISIAAHQLRTPLSSVKWILKMAVDLDLGPLTEKQSEFLGKAYLANERMIHLVNDLLDVSRIEEGKFGFDFSLADINSFLKDVLASFGDDAKRRKIKLGMEIDSNSLFLFFDQKRLKLAVSNLIDNAIRYTSEGGEVTVSLKKEDSEAIIAIKDTGVGIPKEQQVRVFGKFFRADNVVKMQTEGTGLGLYLAKNIVERHNGRIWFESDKQGTTFYFALPIK